MYTHVTCTIGPIGPNVYIHPNVYIVGDTLIYDVTV